MYQFTLVLPDVFNVKMRHILNCSRIYVHHIHQCLSAIALYFNGINQIRVVAFNVPQLTQASFLQLRLGAQSFTLLNTLRDPTQLRQRQFLLNS